MQLGDGPTIDRALAYMTIPSSSRTTSSNASPMVLDSSGARLSPSSRPSEKGKSRAPAGGNAVEEVLRLCGDLSRANVLIDTFRGEHHTPKLSQS